MSSSCWWWKGCGRIFDLGNDPLQITNHLARDSRLGALIRARPVCECRGYRDSIEIAVRAVLGQQLTFVDAKSVIARLVRTFGRPIKTPDSETDTLVSKA